MSGFDWDEDFIKQAGDLAEVLRPQREQAAAELRERQRERDEASRSLREDLDALLYEMRGVWPDVDRWIGAGSYVGQTTLDTAHKHVSWLREYTPTKTRERSELRRRMFEGCRVMPTPKLESAEGWRDVTLACDLGQCFYCGQDGNTEIHTRCPGKLAWDHVWPQAWGGGSGYFSYFGPEGDKTGRYHSRQWIGNMVPACHSCNSVKGAGYVDPRHVVALRQVWGL